MDISLCGNTINPTSMVILLHGYGSNGADLISLAHDWQRDMPGVIFISPDAPTPCEISPFGYQWFSLGDWSPMSMAAGARGIAPWLDDFIDQQLEKYKVAPENLVLCGFSQGTMMANYIAVRRKQKIAGVLGYSGALLCAEEWPQIKLQKPEICLVHGIADNVVAVTAYYHAAQLFQQNDFPFEGHVLSGLMHGINDYGSRIGHDFLKRVLPDSWAQTAA